MRIPKISFETIASAVAVFVGVAALLVAVDEARSVRRQQEASVLPLLKIWTENRTEAAGRTYSIMIDNVGVGPAFIETGAVRWGEATLGSLEDLRARFEKDGGASAFWTARLAGEVIGGDDDLLLFNAAWPGDTFDPETGGAFLVETYAELAIEACYCSVFDRCWVTEMNASTRPREVKSCPAR